MITRIAFAGYAGSGKDEAARALIERGFERHCFGDIIKQEVDSLVREHFGFSALTEDRDQKKLIRRTLEAWGDDNYERITEKFFRELPPLCVNTRLVRVPEAKQWIAEGGAVFLIRRLNNAPATRWEEEALGELMRSCVLTGTIYNDGTVEQLHKVVASLPWVPVVGPVFCSQV